MKSFSYRYFAYFFQKLHKSAYRLPRHWPPITFPTNSPPFKAIIFLTNLSLLFFLSLSFSSGVIEANSVEHDLHNALIPVSAATINCNGNNSSSNVQNVNNTNTNTNSSSSQALSNGGSSSSGRSTPNADTAPGKLFVGGLSWQTSSEKLREYFGMFGTVTDVLIMKDPITQVCRSFIFILNFFPHHKYFPPTFFREKIFA